MMGDARTYKEILTGELSEPILVIPI